MTDHEVVQGILASINCVSQSIDPDLIALAEELAAGVDGPREEEIAEALPVPYTLLESATAELGDDKIRVPRMVIATASKAAGQEWVTSEAQGRRLRRPKAECAVGVHALVDNEWATVLRVVVLWRRVR